MRGKIKISAAAGAIATAKAVPKKASYLSLLRAFQLMNAAELEVKISGLSFKDSSQDKPRTFHVYSRFYSRKT
jgi:hypothetical protein